MARLTRLHPSLTQSQPDSLPKPIRIFNMGMGGGELPRFQLKHCTTCQVESAEIDPAISKIATEHFQVTHPRHKILDGDGFQILKHTSTKYNVIWLDAVSPKEGPRVYIKSQDLQILQNHLEPNGLIIANLGVAKTPTLLKDAERGYKQRYSHGIRVKIPVEDFSRILGTFQAFVSKNQTTPEHTLTPGYVIAVGNAPSLNCARFLADFTAWQKRKQITVQWDRVNNTAQVNPPEDFCQEL